MARREPQNATPDDHLVADKVCLAGEAAGDEADVLAAEAEAVGHARRRTDGWRAALLGT